MLTESEYKAFLKTFVNKEICLYDLILSLYTIYISPNKELFVCENILINKALKIPEHFKVIYVDYALALVYFRKANIKDKSLDINIKEINSIYKFNFAQKEFVAFTNKYKDYFFVKDLFKNKEIKRQYSVVIKEYEYIYKEEFNKILPLIDYNINLKNDFDLFLRRFFYIFSKENIYKSINILKEEVISSFNSELKKIE